MAIWTYNNDSVSKPRHQLTPSDEAGVPRKVNPGGNCAKVFDEGPPKH